MIKEGKVFDRKEENFHDNEKSHYIDNKLLLIKWYNSYYIYGGDIVRLIRVKL